jgi:hypothetical protein
VYARVVVANKDMDPELLCYSSRNKSDGFGPLKVYMWTGVVAPTLNARSSCVRLAMY